MPRIAEIAIVLVLVGACGQDEASFLLQQSAGIRTYVVRHAPPGEPLLCPLGLAADPVVGRFEGSADATGDKSWLVDTHGARLFVVWPEGFALRFDPGATLVDPGGGAVANRGDEVMLSQVNRSEHSGTPSDPYLATGFVLDTCYLPLMP